MGKIKAVKWSVSSDEPEDLQEFLDNSEIVKKNKGLPPKGVYTFDVRYMSVKPNKNGDDRVGVMLVMNEPKKGDGVPWNGYTMNDGFNITDQGKPWLKRFLKGLGLEWADFRDRSKVEEDGEKRQLVQIGKVKFGTQAKKHPQVRALVKHAPADDYNDEEYLAPVRYIPSDDAPSGGDEPNEAAAVDMGEGDGGGGSDAITVDALKAMKVKDLRTRAEEAGVKKKKIEAAGKDKDALVDLIAKALNLPPF